MILQMSMPRFFLLVLLLAATRAAPPLSTTSGLDEAEMGKPNRLLAKTEDDSQNQANPQFTLWGYSAINPDPNPAVTGAATHFDVTLKNGGTNAAYGVYVQLSWNDWGLTFAGWQTIQTNILPQLGAGDQTTTGFDYEFSSAAHTCIEAKITQVNAGGNTLVTDDRRQINLEVIHVGPNPSSIPAIVVPMRNDGDFDIKVWIPRMFCPKNASRLNADSDEFHLDSSFDVFVDIDIPEAPEVMISARRRAGERFLNAFPCTGWKLRLPEHKLEVRPEDFETLSPVVLPANTAWEIEVIAPEPDFSDEELGTMDVVVFAPGVAFIDADGVEHLEVNHVLVRVVRTTVEDLLNRPHLCCIRSIRTRVLLETVLADALQAYLDEDCARVMKLLRFFVQKVDILMCDLSDAENACLVKALHLVVDVARMIAVEYGASRQVIHEGDFFRLSGLYQAAILEYARAC